MQDPSIRSRYSRQILFSGVGEEGQARISKSRVTLVGCGALGSVAASILVRAGVGKLRIVDRDFVEESNLQRQLLFTEADVRELKPKAIAARDHLLAANSTVEVEAIIADLNPDNAVEHLKESDLILDGTDNFETRYLINDVSVRHGIPWIYAACVGSYGVSMVIIPGETACLSCLMESPPDPGTAATCDTAGVIGPIVALVASLQTAEALKLLAGRSEAVSDALMSVDLWTQSVTRVTVPKGGGRRRCATCDGLEFGYLAGRGSRPAVLCGRDAVQVMPASPSRLDLDALASRLSAAGRVTRTQFLLKFAADGCEMTIFPDGRAIVAGTTNPASARALYARYVGA